MAASPRWKVFSSDGEYQASVKDIALAAVLVTFLGEGAQIRDGHKAVVWREGYEGQEATESYDWTEALVMERAEKIWASVHAIREESTNANP